MKPKKKLIKNDLDVEKTIADEIRKKGKLIDNEFGTEFMFGLEESMEKKSLSPYSFAGLKTSIIEKNTMNYSMVVDKYRKNKSSLSGFEKQRQLFQHIVLSVAHTFGLKSMAIKRRNRSRNLVSARMFIVYIASKATNLLTQEFISSQINVSRCMCPYYIKTCPGLIKYDSDTRKRFFEIMNKLRGVVDEQMFDIS